MVLKVPSFSRCFVCAGKIQCNNLLFIWRDWVSARGKTKFIPHKNCLNSHHIKQSFHFDFHPVRGKNYGVIPTVYFSFGFLFWMNSKLFFFLVKLAQRAMAAGAGSRWQWQAISSHALPHIPCSGWKHHFRRPSICSKPCMVSTPLKGSWKHGSKSESICLFTLGMTNMNSRFQAVGYF